MLTVIIKEPEVLEYGWALGVPVTFSAVKKAFDLEGIEILFPHRKVIMVNETA